MRIVSLRRYALLWEEGRPDFFWVAESELVLEFGRGVFSLLVWPSWDCAAVREVEGGM